MTEVKVDSGTLDEINLAIFMVRAATNGLTVAQGMTVLSTVGADIALQAGMSKEQFAFGMSSSLEVRAAKRKTSAN